MFKIFSGLPFKAAQSVIERLVLFNSNLTHLYSLPPTLSGVFDTELLSLSVSHRDYIKLATKSQAFYYQIFEKSVDNTIILSKQNCCRHCFLQKKSPLRTMCTFCPLTYRLSMYRQNLRFLLQSFRRCICRTQHT